MCVKTYLDCPQTSMPPLLSWCTSKAEHHRDPERERERRWVLGRSRNFATVAPVKVCPILLKYYDFNLCVLLCALFLSRTLWMNTTWGILRRCSFSFPTRGRVDFPFLPSARCQPSIHVQKRAVYTRIIRRCKRLFFNNIYIFKNIPLAVGFPCA